MKQGISPDFSTRKRYNLPSGEWKEAEVLSTDVQTDCLRMRRVSKIP